MAQALRLKTIDGRSVGALIAGVAPNSPASRAGLEPGDVITKLNSSPVTSVNELALRLSGIAPGIHVHLTFVRNGKVHHVTATLQKRPENANTAFHGGGDFSGLPSRPAGLGLSLAPLSSQSRERLNIPASVHGVLITGVKPYSPADQAGLQDGDVILSVDSKAVSKPAQVVHDIHTVAAHNARAIAFRIMRNGQKIFIAARIPHKHKG
jgi:serine protease Do